MAAKKPTVGTLIKEARTNAGLSQDKLAKAIDGLSVSDLGKAERDEKELPKDQLKAIAKVTGVTQKSLLEAAEGTTAKKTVTAKTTTAKTAAAAKTTAAVKKSDDLTLTAAEKKLVELYRKADTATRKKVTSLLKGEETDGSELIGELLTGALNTFLKK